MNVVLDWVKANVFIVIFIALMIAALIGLPIVSSGMNASVRKEVQARAQKNVELTKVQKTDLPDGTQGVINEKFLQQYEQVAKVMADDAAAVQKASIEHNHKGRGVVMQGVLPQMPEEMRDVYPKTFYENLMKAYDELLHEVKAGTPPAPETLRDEIQRVRTQFVTQDLKKDLTEELDPDQKKRLTEKLSNTRMSMYADAAHNIGMYVSLAQLYPPVYQQTNPPSICELYNWQWQFWVTQDVMHALNEANKADKSVDLAPVKHVLQLVVSGLPAVSAGPAGGTPGSGSALGMGFGSGNAAPPSPAGEAAAVATGAPIDPKVPVPSDFTASITGRKSNSLYDVVYVDLDVVVETARLPQIIDAISKWNFMSIVELRLEPADSYAAAQNGYFYGAGAVATARMRIETIWMRSWTKQFMPTCIKQILGVPNDPPAQAAPST